MQGDGIPAAGLDPATKRDDEPNRPLRLRPTLPAAMRVNRNVLLVVAAVMAIAVVTSLILLSPSDPRRAAPSPVLPEAASPSVPGFLDRPPMAPTPTENKDLVPDRLPFDGGRSPAVAQNAPSEVAMTPVPDPYMMGVPRTERSPQSPREEAYARALVRSASVSLNTGNNAVLPAQAPSAEADSPWEVLGVQRDGTPAMPSVFNIPGSATTARVATPRQSYQTFLQGARQERDEPAIGPMSVVPLRSPYTIQAGTVIPGVLVTGINSDLPGQILAQVSRDVYDSPTQQTVLIPRGSKLLATYDNDLLAGQSRVLIAFTRIIFPDGRSVTLPGLGATDRTGAAGLSDQVDSHTRRTVGSALLLSLISAGAQLSQPRTGNNAFTPPSAGQVAAGALGQELAEVTAQLLRRHLEAAPTLKIRPGTPCHVFLAGDLTFPGPYTDERDTRK